MQVTTEQTDPCTIVLDVSIDEQQVSRAFDSSYKEFGRYANVPGFRPGKAPRAILERFVDSERVRQHTLEKLIRESFPEAIEEQGVEPYRDASFDPTDLEDKKPFTYKATVPLEPQVTLAEYTGITVEKPIFPVTDEMVNLRIEKLRQDRARLERVNDRAVELGDVLIAETQVVLDGDTNPAPPRRQLVQMGSNIPGYDDELVGMQIGEEKSFTLTYPDDFTDEERRGKSAQFTVKLSSISAKKLPELDDEFARDVAGAETVDALKATVAERLRADADRISNEVAEQRIIEKILEKSDIHFPAILVREEVEEKLRLLSADLRQNNVSYPQYLAQMNLTQEEHQAGLFTEAEAQIRSLLALREVAKQESLQASQDSIDAEFARLAEVGAINAEQYEEFAADPRRRFQVANALIQQGLHDFLFENNTLVEVEQKAAQSDDTTVEQSG